MATFSVRPAPFPPELELPEFSEAGAQLLSRLDSASSLVVAGVAGSGKTVLALAAMQQLRKQGDTVRGLVPSRLRADYLNTSRCARSLPIARPFITPSALAFQVLQQFAMKRRQALREPVLLTGSEEEARIRELLEKVDAPWPSYINAELRSSDYFCSDLRSLFATCAHWGLSAQELDELGRERKVTEWQAGAVMLSQYEPSFKDNKWDAARMQDRAARLLQNWEQDAAILEPPLLPDWIVADDLQDCPASTIRMLREMGKRGTKIFALFNPKVAAETFRGGYPNGAKELSEQLGCPLVSLEESFRETAGGLTLSDPLSQKLGGDSARDQKIAQFSTISSQARAVAEYLRYQHLKRYVAWNDMAIIARTQGQLDELSALLEGLEIPINHRRRPMLFKSNQISGSLLRFFTIAGQSELAKSISPRKTKQNGQGQAPAYDLGIGYCWDEKLITARGKAIRQLLRSPLFAVDSLQMLRLERSLVGAQIAVDTKLEEFYALLGTPRFPLSQLQMVEGAQVLIRCHQVFTAAVSALTLPPTQALEKIWLELQLEEQWRHRALAGDEFADQALDAVISLVRHAEIWSQRHLSANMTDYCAVLLRQRQAEDVLSGSHGLKPAVALETVFSAAGRTWDTCVVIGMQDGQWPLLSESGSLLRVGELSELMHATALLSPSGKLQEVPGGSRKRALETERSLARCALSRAREKMLVTARSGNEDVPSIFFINLGEKIKNGDFNTAQYLGNSWDTLGGNDLTASSKLRDKNHEEQQLFPSVRSLVGYLRALLSQDIPVDAPGGTAEDADSYRRKALETLAYLATQTVTAANPQSWRQVGRDSSWWTNPAGLKPAGSRVGISPSTLEQLNDCELRWLLERRGGQEVDATGSLSWGTLVHQIAEEMGDNSLKERLDFFYSHWPQNKETFYSRTELQSKEDMIVRLSHYLDNHKAPAVSEISSRAFVGESALLNARIDRLEAGEDGVRIVDFKTMKNPPSAQEVKNHLQLACYQLVLEAMLAGDDSQAAKALSPVLKATKAEVQSSSLVIVSKAKGSREAEIPKEMSQAPLTDEQKEQLAQTIVDAAQVAAGAVFKAVENAKCDHCKLRSCCPLMSEGESVL